MAAFFEHEAFTQAQIVHLGMRIRVAWTISPNTYSNGAIVSNLCHVEMDFFYLCIVASDYLSMLNKLAPWIFIFTLSCKPCPIRLFDDETTRINLEDRFTETT